MASAPITNPRDALFDVLIDSNRRVAAILEADRNAVNGKDVYDDDYFEKFFTTVKPKTRGKNATPMRLRAPF